MSFRRRAFGFAVLSIGCATPSTSDPRPSPPDTAAASTVAILKAQSLTRAAVDARLPIVREGEGFAIERGAWRAAGVQVEVDPRGRARLRAGADPDAWLSPTPEADDVESESVDGVLIAKLRSGDEVAVVALPRGVEDFRVFRAATSSVSGSWRLRTGSALAPPRLEDGHVVVDDLAGDPVFRSGAIFAVDANGVRREAHLSLVGDRLTATVQTDDFVFPVVLDPIWTSAGALTQSTHRFGIAAPLPGGQVLVAGGPDTPSSAAERFNGSTWAATGSMSTPRAYSQFGVMSDGTVVISGGLVTACAAAATAERYNPVAGTFSAAGTNVVVRYLAASGVFSSGTKLLLAGGTACSGTTALSSAEVYTLGGGWAATANMAKARAEPGSVTLGDGRVLVSGGYDESSNVLSSAEIYDPASGTWSSAGSMSVPRLDAIPVLLTDGRVLVAGGFNTAGTAASSAEIYNPTAGTWTTVPSMAKSHRNPAFFALSGGRAVIAGGGTSAAELYDAARNTWTTIDAMATTRSEPIAAMIGADKWLVTSGSAADASPKSAEIFEQYANGTACTSHALCKSAQCADGVCCNAACTGACQACTAALKGSGASGVCGAIADGTDPQTECTPQSCTGGTITKAQVCNGAGACRANGTVSCSGYGCSGTACRTTCSVATDCDATHYCSSGTCTSKKSGGTSCVAAVECTSGNCVDGVCCDTACAGACQACTAAKKGSGANGVCGSIADGADPDLECPAQSCAGGVQQAAQVCNGAGACRTNGSTTCAPYLCAGTSCGATCAGDATCVAASHCNGSACVADFDPGVACTRGAECKSGFCADGVCCDRACGACEACTAALKGSGTDGVCGPAAADTDPHATCAPDSAFPASCKEDGACDGTGICRKYAKSGVACGATTCADGKVTGQICNGAGTCSSMTGTSCAPYKCASDGKTCGTSCAIDGDCADGAFCGAGVCIVKKTNGTACGLTHECTSGECVDGVCCDTACDSTCQACDVAGSLGTCQVISGTPHGSRKACASDGSACGGSCDGKSAACTFPSAATTCGTTCTENKETNQICDGSGACVAGTASTPCTPYTCDSATMRCRGGCTADLDCTPGNRCLEGKCAPSVGAKCSEDLQSSIAPDKVTVTPCRTFLCDPSNGECRKTCNSSDECSSVSICNTVTHVCDAATPAEPDPQTCGCRLPGRDGPSSTAPWIATMLAALAMRRRLRR